MESEPIWVPSNKLTAVCHQVLGWIMSKRQENKEAYVRDRVAEYNATVQQQNRKRKYLRWLGIKPKMLITPYGMELEIKRELDAMPHEARVEHPMIQIHQAYGMIESEAKDCLIQCQMVDAVPISGQFCRGISHMEVDVSALRRAKFGFYPR